MSSTEIFLIVKALHCTYGCRVWWLDSMWWDSRGQWGRDMERKKKTIIQSIIKILVCCSAADSVYVSHTNNYNMLLWWWNGFFPLHAALLFFFCVPSHKAKKKKKIKTIPNSDLASLFRNLSLFWWNPQPEKFYLLESNCQPSILHVVAEDPVSECSHQTFSFNILCK